VAITFDDGPSEETRTTQRLLESVGMPATFFVLGEQISRHPDIVKELEAAGHEVATHGFAHTSALRTRPARLRADLRRAVELHHSVLGRPPRFYRPAYGHVTATTLHQVRRQHLELILWSAWGKEFSDPHPGSVLRRLEAGLAPGAIVLLHDNDVSCPPGTAAVTHQVLGGLRDLLDARGLQAVTLSELLAPMAADAS
jgi:peptidoglycan/xylan/chitin deacetylase (PgdA/CDA1 family)